MVIHLFVDYNVDLADEWRPVWPCLLHPLQRRFRAPRRSRHLRSAGASLVNSDDDREEVVRDSGCTVLTPDGPLNRSFPRTS